MDTMTSADVAQVQLPDWYLAASLRGAGALVQQGVDDAALLRFWQGIIAGRP